MNHGMSRNRWLLLLIAIGVFASAALLGTPLVLGSALAQDTDVFLPVVRDGSHQVREVTPTSGPTATPSPTPTMTPPPQPTLDPGAVEYAGGSCTDGFHLIHESGALGIQDPDTFTHDEDDGGPLEPAAGLDVWDGYYCVPDDDVADAACSIHGAAHLLDGVAACACETGYVGAQCNICAPGYAASPDGLSCVQAPEATPGIVIRGADDSVERDQVVELSASSVASPDASASAVTANTRWEIERGYGCLLSSRDASECLDSVEGTGVFFKAPPGEGLNETGLLVTTFDDGGGVVDTVGATVMAQPPGYIPINGWGKPQLQPILDQMMSFMKTRCVGAAVLGVAYYGKPVGIWGLGKTYGRASSTIFDDACGPDEADPHYPTAPNVGNQMGIMIGSVSKTVTFATARWALKDALELWDKDVDLVAMNTSKLVSAQRNADGRIRFEAWSINEAGVVAQQGNGTTSDAARDFSMTRLTDTRMAVAMRTPDNGLQIGIWGVDGAGQFTEQYVTDVTGLPGTANDTITQVRVTHVMNDRLLAAVRRADDTLSLILWQVNGNGTLTEHMGLALDTIRARDVDVITLDGAAFPRIIVGWRAVDSSLDVRWYDVTADNNLTLRDEVDTSAPIEDMDLTPLAAGRFASALRLANGDLRVTSWALNDPPSANLYATDTEDAGPVEDLAISAIGTSGFAVVVRQPNTALKLITWVLDGGGLLTRRGDDTAGANNGAALANAIYGGETLTSVLFAAVRTAENTLKVIPWNVTSVDPLRLANEGTGGAVADYSWDDDDVEALRLTGFDLPQGLLPERNRKLFAGEETLPIQLPGASVDTNDDGIADYSCSALAGTASAEWQQVRLRHLFGHRTGMAKSFSPSAEGITTTYLDELRGLALQTDWADEESALRAEWGDANVEQARAALGWNTNLVTYGDTDGYLVEAPTLLEILEAIASRCLPSPFGTYQYSNASPQIMRSVIEHVTGMRYAYQEGYPAQHPDTLYAKFFDSQLSLSTSPVDNIFPHRPGLEGPDDVGPPGPILRAWKASENSYYWTSWDRKRPHCDWNGSGCDFTNWSDANGGRINWYWENAEVAAPYYGNTGGTATGGLRAEPQSFLKFMSEYWAGGYGGGSPSTFDPIIGQERNNTWNLNVSHNGSVGGGYAFSIHRSNGVDLFVAVNQSGGKSGEEYNVLDNMMVDGINAVDWDSVELLDSLQVSP